MVEYNGVEMPTIDEIIENKVEYSGIVRKKIIDINGNVIDKGFEEPKSIKGTNTCPVLHIKLAEDISVDIPVKCEEFTQAINDEAMRSKLSIIIEQCMKCAIDSKRNLTVLQ